MPVTVLGGRVVLAAVAALALAGCGAQNGSAPSGATSASTAPSVDAVLAAKVPDAIRADGKLLIGVDSTYPPNEFLDTDGKTVVGFDVDLFNAVAGKLGLTTQWQTSKFDDIIPGVQSGRYEIGVSSFSITVDRKKAVNMVSYFNAGTQWASQKGNKSGIKPDDACGKRVAVQAATVQADDIADRSKKCVSEGKPAIIIDQYQAHSDATEAVVSGKDDALLADSPVCAYAVIETKGQLQVLGEIYAVTPYGYVIKKDQLAFADAVREAVLALMSDGTYRTILGKWGVQGGAVSSSAVNP